LRLGSRAPGIVNALARSGLGRWAGEAILGVDRHRTLPALARETFSAQFAARHRTASSQPAATRDQAAGVLFDDTFTNFCHPEIGVAAADVLETAGVHARLVPHVCCGRPLISKGLLDEARTLAARNVDALFDAAAHGAPILFLEPSCLSAVREDAPDLLRGEAQRRARTVASVSRLFEGYVPERWNARALPLSLRSRPS